MAGWLKHHAKWILGSFACVVLLIVAGRAVYLNRQPDECVLCGSGEREVYHAPVIVNLSTGEVSEMRVYDPSKTGRNNEIHGKSRSRLANMQGRDSERCRSYGTLVFLLRMPQETCLK